MSERVRVGGYRPGAASWLFTAACVGAGLLHLFAPLIWSWRAPSAQGWEQEAPWVGALSLALLGLLAVAIWIDSNRESWQLGVAIMFVALNVALRDSFNISLGAEFNYILPFVVGMAAGAPMGFFVGVASCVVSQFLLGQISVPLAAQMLVWGLAGVAGGMLRPLGTKLSCIVAPFVGLAFGRVSGVLLNAIGWPTDTAATPAFIPGASFEVNLSALVEFTREMSAGVDTLRGLTTAIGLAVVGYPLSKALRRALRPPLVDERPTVPHPDDPRPDAITRRARARAASRIWKDGHDHDPHQ